MRQSGVHPSSNDTQVGLLPGLQELRAAAAQRLQQEAEERAAAWPRQLLPRWLRGALGQLQDALGSWRRALGTGVLRCSSKGGMPCVVAHVIACCYIAPWCRGGVRHPPWHACFGAWRKS